MTMKKLQLHYDKDYGGDVDDVDDDTEIGPVLGILYPGQSPIAPAPHVCHQYLLPGNVAPGSLSLSQSAKCKQSDDDDDGDDGDVHQG